MMKSFGKNEGVAGGQIIVFIVILLVINVILFTIINFQKNGNLMFWGGGYNRNRDINKLDTIVVDTLNMTHEICSTKSTSTKSDKKYKISHADILKTIKTVTNKLRPQIKKIMFVTKVKEYADSSSEGVRESFEKLSKELNVDIYLTEKLDNPKKSTSHASIGRDDFYTILMAWKYRCPVLGQDYYKDLRDMKFGEMDSFFVRKYLPFKKFEEKDYINPTAQEYKRIHRPRVIRWEEFSHQKDLDH